MQTSELSNLQQQQSLTTNNIPLTPIIDLQIALLTPLPIVTKAMPVRLTRRHHCSELVSSPVATMSQQQQLLQTNTQLMSAYSSPNYYPPISSPSFSTGNNIIGANGMTPGSGANSVTAEAIQKMPYIFMLLISATLLMSFANNHVNTNRQAISH